MVRLRMRPLVLAERVGLEGTVSLGGLLGGTRPDIGGHSSMGLADYAREVVTSGLPGVRSAPARSAPRLVEGYLAEVVERGFDDLGRHVRRPAALTAWLTAYAAATATTASYETILAAATPGSGDKPAKTTAIAYRSVLERMWLLAELPAWTGTQNRLSSLAQAPKHHLADPAMAASLLGVGADGLLDTPLPGRASVIKTTNPLLGRLLESLATLSVRVYAQANGARVSHLRTAKGDHEVDLIVARPDGGVVGLEVKAGQTPDDADVRHLAWLQDRIGPQCLDTAVLTTGTDAYRRPDGIAVIPLALLGP
jgi:predicted AAA+ superfamily ATPase